LPSLQTDSQGNIDCAASSHGGIGCFLFTPPVLNQLGWTDPAASLFVLVDYAGLANQYLGGALGTTMDGSVSEEPLADGRADVTVLVHTKNALTWAVAGFDSANGPLLFGHRAQDVAGGADAALGESTLQLRFINTARRRDWRGAMTDNPELRLSAAGTNCDTWDNLEIKRRTLQKIPGRSKSKIVQTPKPIRSPCLIACHIRSRPKGRMRP